MSFIIFINHSVLVRVALDLKPLSGTLGTKREHAPDRTPVHCKASLLSFTPFGVITPSRSRGRDFRRHDCCRIMEVLHML